jgi:lactoylglutathione lyase
MKARLMSVSGYQGDATSLPVPDLEAAIPFYQNVLGFQVLERLDVPVRSATLGRDEVTLGLAENGGDPAQDGAFFEVESAEEAFAELRANGLNSKEPNFRIDQQGEASYKVFFVIAPDGLCY